MESFDTLLGMVPIKNVDIKLKKSLEIMMESVLQSSEGNTFEEYIPQFKILFKKLNSSSKLVCLKNSIHREMIVELILKKSIEEYNYSYLNKAKLTTTHLDILKEVGPYLFCEGLMIVSKLNTIYKNYSRIFIEDHLYQESQSVIDSQIRQILKMCDEKKRSVNNNLKKLIFLFDDVTHRVEFVKQLGKLLRQSWKMEKNKKKNGDDNCKQISPERVKNWENKNISQQQQIPQIFQEQEENNNEQLSGQLSLNIQKISSSQKQKSLIISLKQYSYQCQQFERDSFADILFPNQSDIFDIV